MKTFNFIKRLCVFNGAAQTLRHALIKQHWTHREEEEREGMWERQRGRQSAIAFPLCTWQCNLNCSCLRIWLHFTRRCPLRTQPNEFTRTKCGQQQKEVVKGVREGEREKECREEEEAGQRFRLQQLFVCLVGFFSANQMNQNRSKLELKSRSRRRRRRWRHCINIRLWAAFLFVFLLHRPQALGRDEARERAMHILR